VEPSDSTHEVGTLTETTGAEPQFDTIKANVATAARMIGAEGLVEAFGHVSARIGGSSFVITPRKGLASISADELLEVEVSEGVMRVTRGDPGTLPVEAVIHAAIYVSRPDVDAIVRDHGEASTVFGVSGQSLRPVHALGAVGRGDVPIFDSSDLISDWAGGDDLCRVLGASPAVLLRGNGRVVVGASVEEAFARAVLLEESARIQLAARSAGFEARPLTTAEQDRAFRDLANPGQVRRVWDHYRARHGLGDWTE
jgi:ribulose-5-phosphate 4-epimerase/fuculose-1-phosphate aldolase